ncbi:Serine/threonine-protein phosphatase 6 regulatory ankyrin repeat subunit C [Paramyrothecium foliicola]|nr:Serine/threonine-protein phosphatase 6 regulatory ankyrin repeat subunit C [Paramyrothecium foliicola]
MVKAWGPLEEEIRQLYEVENKPLAEVMRLIRGKYDFVASERSYRTQLQKWGLMKYNTQTFRKATTRKTRRIDAATATQVCSTTQHFIRRDTGFPATTSTVSPLSSGINGQYYLDARQSNPDITYGFEVHEPTSNAVLPQVFEHRPVDCYGRTRLHTAVINQDVDSVKALVLSKDAMDNPESVDNIAIHYAVMSSNREILNILIRYGADVNARQINGQTPLHLATGSIEVTKLLLHNGADPSVQDECGNTPLHLAIDLQRGEQFIRTLLEARSNPNTINDKGLTPFLSFLEHNLTQGLKKPEFLSLVSHFLRNGASATQLTPQGQTPLELFVGWSGTDCFDRERGKSISKENAILRQFLAKGASIMTPMKSGKPLILAYFEEAWNKWSCDRSLATKLCQLVNTEEIGQHANVILYKLADDANSEDPTASWMTVLLKNGANANYIHTQSGRSPLTALLKKKKFYKSVMKPMEVLLSHGADPWLFDGNGSCGLFEVIGSFGDDAAALVLPMLEADMKAEGQPVTADCQVVERVHWDGWKQAIAARNWEEAIQLILSEKHTFHDIDSRIKKLAIIILARKHMSLARVVFKDGSDAIMKRRTYVAEILRACRNHECPLEAKDMDHLLEWCECAFLFGMHSNEASASVSKNSHLS